MIRDSRQAIVWLLWVAFIAAAGVFHGGIGAAALAGMQSETDSRENAQASEAAPAVDQPAEPKQAADETSVGPAANDDDAPEAPRPTFDRQSADILDSLKPVTADADLVTVKISTEGRPVALGVIVDGGGLVLTKASELKGNLMCKLSDGRSISAKVFGIHKKTDLALLQIEAAQLPTAAWSTLEAPTVGHWVVTPRVDEPPALGIVSVKPRLISPPVGYMGVELDEKLDPQTSGVRITRIRANSPAEKAGMRVNDVIVEVNDEKVTNREMLISAVRKNPVGAEVKVKASRGGETMEFTMQLTDFSVFERDADRSQIQNEMGGRLSRRRLDFPMALQHDTTLSPNECGGPIVDLSGKIVGVNIARAGRVDSLALPAATVLSVIESLKSGELRPDLVFKTEIAKIETRLQEIVDEMKSLPQRKTELTEKLSSDDAQLEELKLMAADVQARLKALEEQRNETAKQWNSVSSDESKLQKEKERLESDLQKFSTGTN
jgi:serine protease Do